MTTKREATIGILLTAVVLVGFAVMELYLGPRSFLAGFDRGMHARYGAISKGDGKMSVVQALGEPRARSEGFNLPQRHGFEHLFDAADKSPAVEYYQWVNGMNWYYCIGFDAAGTVVVKGEGHS